MNSIQIMLGSSGRSGEEAPVRHVRLGSPLGGTLSTFDFRNERIELYAVTAEVFIGSEPANDLIEELESGDRFSKLTLYARSEPGEVDNRWTEAGFRREGAIPGFFPDDTEAVLWARYSGDERAVETRKDEHDKALAIAQSNEPTDPTLPAGYTSRAAIPSDSEQISDFLNSVIEEFQGDISPEHLVRQIATVRSLFQVIEDADQRLVAVASAELDVRRQVAVITDCVMQLDQLDRRLSSAAVGALHDSLVRHPRINAVYSLANADEAGANTLFRQLGYECTGRLVNNYRTPDGWESKNIWCRSVNA